MTCLYNSTFYSGWQYSCLESPQVLQKDIDLREVVYQLDKHILRELKSIRLDPALEGMLLETIDHVQTSPMQVSRPLCSTLGLADLANPPFVAVMVITIIFATVFVLLVNVALF